MAGVSAPILIRVLLLVRRSADLTGRLGRAKGRRGGIGENQHARLAVMPVVGLRQAGQGGRRLVERRSPARRRRRARSSRPRAPRPARPGRGRGHRAGRRRPGRRARPGRGRASSRRAATAWSARSGAAARRSRGSARARRGGPRRRRRSAAPRDSASSPSAPVPAKRSSTRRPSGSGRLAIVAVRQQVEHGLAHPVRGRPQVPVPRRRRPGADSRVPRNRPPMMRMPASGVRR